MSSDQPTTQPNQRQTPGRRRLRLLLAVLVVSALTGWAGMYLANSLLDRPLQLTTARLVDLPPGGSLAGLVHGLAREGVVQQPGLLVRWAQWQGLARSAKAGEYQITPGTSHRQLLQLLVSGSQFQRQLTLLEGASFRAMMASLAAAPRLQQTLAGLSPAEVMVRLGRAGQPPEAALYPDTYSYTAGSTDLQLARQAARRMDTVLAEIWQQRDLGLPLASPAEALVLASMVEKETGWAPDRPRIAAVFLNRLRRNMRLQSDPTVIFALGEAFDGNLRRRDLRYESPYNTYRVRGLPPGPIAAPGRAALLAAVQPAPLTALYFVGKGDGTSAFTNTLAEHQEAVRSYQLQRQDNYRSAPPETPSAAEATPSPAPSIGDPRP